MTSFFDSIVFLLTQCALLGLTSAAVVNVTVDDTKGDEMTGAEPTYLPVGDWALGAQCKGCSAQPDASLAFNGTWHDTTHSQGHVDQRTVQIKFGGTAVYAFFITANNFSYTTLTNLTFAIDGDQVGTFVHEPGPHADFDYNVLGYSNSTLDNAFHELVISTTGDDSLLLFDYLIYTVDKANIPTDTITTSLPIPTLPVPTGTQSTPQTTASLGYSSPSKRKFTSAIIGGAVGALILLFGLLVIFCFIRRRRSRREPNPASSEAVPYVINSTASSTATIGGVIHNSDSHLPVYSEKRGRIRMEEIQRRIETLRSRINELETKIEVTEPLPSLHPQALVDPHLKEQLNELRSQVSTLLVQQQRELEKITQ